MMKEPRYYFDYLEPCTIRDLEGSWTWELDPCSPRSFFTWALKDYIIIKWVGKTFTGNKASALVMSFLGCLFNVPVIGNATLYNVESPDGVVSAAMFYDWLQIVDYFRRITDDKIMGVMTIRGKVILYFYLNRVK